MAIKYEPKKLGGCKQRPIGDDRFGQERRENRRELEQWERDEVRFQKLLGKQAGKPSLGTGKVRLVKAVVRALNALTADTSPSPKNVPVISIQESSANMAAFDAISRANRIAQAKRRNG